MSNTTATATPAPFAGLDLLAAHAIDFQVKEQGERIMAAARRKREPE